MAKENPKIVKNGISTDYDMAHKMHPATKIVDGVDICPFDGSPDGNEHFSKEKDYKRRKFRKIPK